MLKLTKSFLETMYHSSKVLLRTVRVTLAEEVELSRARAKARYESQDYSRAQRAESSTVPSLSESMQILGVRDITDLERIHERYQQLFQANERSKGGSFYIQSKVVRARQRIDQELAKASEKLITEQQDTIEESCKGKEKNSKHSRRSRRKRNIK